MKVWIIAYIVVAIIVFVATCVLIEISASDVDRALSTALNKPLIDYKKALLVSALWILALAYLILLFIVKLISRIIINRRKDK